MSKSRANEIDPGKGTPVPEEATREQAADARETATADAAREEADAGARTPTPGEQADAEVSQRARRARKRRAEAERDPAPGAAGGAGSKGKEAAANAERPRDEDAERPAREDADESGSEADEGIEEEARAEDAEDDAASDTQEESPQRSARRRSAETTTAASRRTARRRDSEESVSVRAQAKYVRTAPRKARLVIEHIRGKSVDHARAILLTTPRAASKDVLKLLDSCVANAENNHELSADELRVDKAYVDEGPTLKRYRPRALGRATRIRKRTSHMTIYLTNREAR